MELDFGSFKKEKTVTPKSVTPKVPRTDYKKMYEITKKSLDEWKKRAEGWRQDTNRLHDENLMLRQQEEQMKKAIDILSKQVERFKFRPQQYSQIAQVLTYMRLHGTKAALQRVKEMVGTTEISAVRKWIFDLLEEPYK